MRELFEISAVKHFKDIFGQWGFSKTKLAKAIGINNSLIEGLVNNPGKLTQYHIQRIADYFGVTYADIQSTIDAQLADVEKP